MARPVTRARAKRAARMLMVGGALMLAGSVGAALSASYLQAAIALVVGMYFVGMGIQRSREADELDD